jgi:hypothetical protein
VGRIVLVFSVITITVLQFVLHVLIHVLDAQDQLQLCVSLVLHHPIELYKRMEAVHVIQAFMTMDLLLSVKLVIPNVLHVHHFQFAKLVTPLYLEVWLDQVVYAMLVIMIIMLI